MQLITNTECGGPHKMITVFHAVPRPLNTATSLWITVTRSAHATAHMCAGTPIFSLETIMFPGTHTFS